MAFNPEPKVAAAREIAQKFGKSRVIVLMLTEETTSGGMTIEYASYGETERLCIKTKRLADLAYDAVFYALERGAGV